MSGGSTPGGTGPEGLSEGSGGDGLGHGGVAAGGAGAIHAGEGEEVAAGVDDGDVDLQAHLGGLSLGGLEDDLGAGEVQFDAAPRDERGGGSSSASPGQGWALPGPEAQGEEEWLKQGDGSLGVPPLGEHPGGQVGVAVGAIPAIVADASVLGEPGVAAGFLEGFDHLCGGSGRW